MQDLTNLKFEEQVYKITKQIPIGKVSTYKLVAETLGRPKAFRAVGQALKKNPYAPAVPCHRVIKSDFSLGGFNGNLSGPFLQKKIELLKSEGVSFLNGKVNSKFVHDFKD
ncbi:methylated-DNA--protein-cysteine methyltransferase-like [Octopus sinensis]|uniref:Methylated-DNA--protein-cysteine methyltransferase n=1 Tax=Octopus sinensis TaxID=2607531 RepID=A0A6P7U4R6_9MOLL|nr:methylated-DNA--protein-cysteine methyltransferase-like [Octopus sinensis]